MPRRTTFAALLTCTLASIAFAADRWTGDGISWQVPDGWTQKQGSSEFRFAQIDAGDNLTVVVSRFPGDVGGTLANVNRWRAQLRAPADQGRRAGQGDEEAAEEYGDATALLTDMTNAAGDQRSLRRDPDRPQGRPPRGSSS